MPARSRSGSTGRAAHDRRRAATPPGAWSPSSSTNSIGRATPVIDSERAVAIFDLIEENMFRPIGRAGGPFRLKLSIVDRAGLRRRRRDGTPVVRHILSLTPFRRIIKDYFMICDSYYEAIRTATPSQIEAIDMGRRGLHNEGADDPADRLAGKIDVDFDTARRLFTLVCALHWKG